MSRTVEAVKNKTQVRETTPAPTTSHQTARRASGSAASPTPSSPATPRTGDQVSVARDTPAGGASPVNFGAWGGGQPTASAKAAPSLSLGRGELLRHGSQGGSVRTLQEMLKSRGADIEVDGQFGPQTRRAVLDFQKKNGLGVDGIVGPETMGALNGPRPNPPAPSTEGARKDETGTAKPVDRTPETSGAGRFSGTRGALDNLPSRLRPYADAFQKAGEKYGIDPRFLAAISMHETGGGTSSAFRHKNNAMGIMGRSGIRRFSSVDASIDQMARGLANPQGYYRGRSTIGRIGSVYAPVGAANDPYGLNNHWVKGVSKFYRQLGGDPSQTVIFR